MSTPYRTAEDVERQSIEEARIERCMLGNVDVRFPDATPGEIAFWERVFLVNIQHVGPGGLPLLDGDQARFRADYAMAERRARFGRR